MSTEDDGIHLYGTPKKPKPRASEGLRGERTAGNTEASDQQASETKGTSGGQPPEDVEDRPNVSTVKPEDYPLDQRARGET